MARFKVVSYDEAKECDPEGDYLDNECSYLVDTRTNKVVASDDGWQHEWPEDMSFSRHLGVYVDLLNKVAQEKD